MGKAAEMGNLMAPSSLPPPETLTAFSWPILGRLTTTSPVEVATESTSIAVGSNRFSNRRRTRFSPSERSNTRINGETMRKLSLFRSLLLVTAVLGSATRVCGQEAQGASDQKNARSQKTASKPRKVWTDDDLGSMHGSPGVSVAQAHPESAMPAPQPGPDSVVAADAKKSDSKPALKTGPAVLAHPKTIDDADNMIAW